MLNNHKTTNKYLALATFFISLVIYTLTLAPTASFWDAGEFIAVAYKLQVNHPPGAPLYSIIGRIFSMFMPTSYVALSINFLSGLVSALTIMFLYLIIVRLIREWRGHPDEYSLVDKLGTYGGAMIGALTFAVTDTFWFNAVEAEVYAMSMFFTAIVVWMALKWSENHEDPNNDRWLVLIAYMFGLAIGVHLLNLLAMFFVAMIVYYKKQEFTLLSFAIMGGITVVAFFSIYPFIIQILPDIASGVSRSTYGLIGPLTFVILIVGAVTFGIYYTHRKNYRIANMIMVCYATILIGYSSYAVIFIRSIANPPIDENDPETIDDFVSFLKRDQYGDTPILKGNTFSNAKGNIDDKKEVFFPRRHSAQPNHIQQYANYSSDFDFFIRYQISHMYIRYFNWNFIGRESDIQDTGWQSGFSDSPYKDNFAHNSYFYIPFLLGLFGMFYHFRNDKWRALAVLALFIVTGLAIIIFLNQPPQQPRERDYAYVGSFFAFSIWIGLGVTGLVDLLKGAIKENVPVTAGLLGVLLLASPVLMGYQNWDDHDRSDRYVAPDYARNLLNSVAPNSIIFTNGDNDTFPLWYAQEVEGIRTDVRVVCLSLLNTDWYIKQLKHQWSHESAPLNFSYSDEQIEEIAGRGGFVWTPRQIDVQVDKPFLEQAFSGDYEYKEAIGVKPDTALPLLASGVDFEMPVDSLDDVLSWRLQGRQIGSDQAGNPVHILQTQDAMILDLIQSNNWLRPIYFANTVSTVSQLGLQDYFRTEGQAYRIVPKKFEKEPGTIFIDTDIAVKRLREFDFKGWDNESAYLDENIRRIISNYRFGISQLADQFIANGEPDSAAYWLKFGEEKIPFRKDDDNVRFKTIYAYKYVIVNLPEDGLRLVEDILPVLMSKLENDYAIYSTSLNQQNSIEGEISAARTSGNIQRAQSLRQEQQTLVNSINGAIQRISDHVRMVSIVQNIYFKSGRNEEALALIDQIHIMTDNQFEGQLPLSSNKEESDLRMVTWGL